MSNIPPTAFKLSKPQLDAIATVLGITSGICIVFVTNGIGNPKVLGSISGVALILQGYISQKPATQHPTTAELEQKKINNE